MYILVHPGLNGSCTPFVKVHNLYFDDRPEPQNQEYEIVEELRKRNSDAGIFTVQIGSNPIEYYEAKLNMLKNAVDGFKIEYLTDEEDGMFYVYLEETNENKYDI